MPDTILNNVIPGFLDPLDVMQLDDDTWKLLDDLRYWSAVRPALIKVPYGFVTDFASTPQIVWTIGMPKSGIYDKAAVIHDYLYTMGGHVAGVPFVYTKADADAIFKEALGVVGVNGIKRWAMYTAVRLFGRGAF